jgi:hypothetical protein
MILYLKMMVMVPTKEAGDHLIPCNSASKTENYKTVMPKPEKCLSGWLFLLNCLALTNVIMEA